jgi:hypothetical protein
LRAKDEKEAHRGARIRASRSGKRKLSANQIGTCQAAGCGWRSPAFLGKPLTRLHHVVRGNEDEIVLLCPNHHSVADRLGKVDRGLPRDLNVQIGSVKELLEVLRDFDQDPQNWYRMHWVPGGQGL